MAGGRTPRTGSQDVGASKWCAECLIAFLGGVPHVRMPHMHTPRCAYSVCYLGGASHQRIAACSHVSEPEAQCL